MAAETGFKGFQLHRNLQTVKISCSWCGTGVPLPAGDFSGVCIECGTVMFRGSRRGTDPQGEERAIFENENIPLPIA